MQNTKNESKTGRALKFDPKMVEIESEADRVYICSKLTHAIDKYYLKSKNKSPAEDKSLRAIMPEVLEKNIAATWECNFGNMVLGKDKVKQIRLTNVGLQPVTYSFDMKQLKLNGVTTEQESQVPERQETMHFGLIKSWQMSR